MPDETGPFAYGYLVIDQRAADRVTFPDGRTELHTAGGGEDVASAWNASAPESDQERHGYDDAPAEEDVEEKLAELVATWEAATDAALRELERDTSSLGSPESRRASYLRRHPRPTREVAAAALRAASRGAPRRPKARSVQVERCWWATVRSSLLDLQRPLGEPGPIPRDAVAQLLGTLSEDGWDVRHVTEERAAIHGPDASTTVCTAMNVLLSRRRDRAA